MPFPDVLRLKRHWKRHPPAHIALQVGFKIETGEESRKDRISTEELIGLLSGGR